MKFEPYVRIQRCQQSAREFKSSVRQSTSNLPACSLPGATKQRQQHSVLTTTTPPVAYESQDSRTAQLQAPTKRLATL
jgi:hypothetical protein